MLLSLHAGPSARAGPIEAGYREEMDLNLPRSAVDPVVRETRTAYRSLMGGGFSISAGCRGDLRRPKCTVHRYVSRPLLRTRTRCRCSSSRPHGRHTRVFRPAPRLLHGRVPPRHRSAYHQDYGDISTCATGTSDSSSGRHGPFPRHQLPFWLARLRAPRGASLQWLVPPGHPRDVHGGGPSGPSDRERDVRGQPPSDFGKVRVLGPVRITGGPHRRHPDHRPGPRAGRYPWQTERAHLPVAGPGEADQEAALQLQSRDDPDTLAQIEAGWTCSWTPWRRIRAAASRRSGPFPDPHQPLLRRDNWSLKGGRVVELDDVTVPVMAMAPATSSSHHPLQPTTWGRC